MNTLYTEFAAVLCAYAAAGCLMLACCVRPDRAKWWAGLVLALAGLGMSRQQHAFLPLLFALLALIAWRAVQGLGAGAMQPVALTIVGDLFDPHERARIRPRVDRLDATAPAGQGRGGVTLHLVAPGGQEHLHHRAAGPEPTRHHEAVAAVVTLAAHHHDLPVADRGEPADDQRGGARAGRVHEPAPGNAELADRARVQRAHLGGGEDGPHGISAPAGAAGSPTG